MTQEGRELRSWRQRVGQPLKGDPGNVAEETFRQNAKTGQNPDSLRVSIGDKASAKTSEQPPKPPAVALEDQCWGHACHRPAASVQDTRWQGRYCSDCQKTMAADADVVLRTTFAARRARMEEE